MGWSCAAAANDTMRAWVDACVKQTGSSNTYKVGEQQYFWEVSSREHVDGAITGNVYKMLPDNRCVGCASFRINPDGSVARAPAFLKGIKGDARSKGFGVGSGGF